jgi:hypothetical protein
MIVNQIFMILFIYINNIFKINYKIVPNKIIVDKSIFEKIYIQNYQKYNYTIDKY